MKPLSVLALQPYFGGSHAQFHNGWIESSEHDWTTLTLPARHWKWRMRHAAIHFKNEIHKLADASNKERPWDVIVATDMMNIAELKGLLQAGLREIPIVLYFHENQFIYPNRWSQERDRHFPFTNFVSAIAADKLWFNSQFNLDSLIEALNESVKSWPDFQPAAEIESLAAKSKIQPPGIEPPPFSIEPYQADRAERAKSKEPIHLVWAARWEHDKNPQALLDALRGLRDSQIPFKVSVIGQVFRSVPEEFEKIQNEFGAEIVRWGFQETREQYWESLAEADLFISTATHEFFGLSAAEAIAAGCFPVLPNRLAYPELLKYAFEENAIANHLYQDDNEGLVDALRKVEHMRGNSAWPTTRDSAKMILSNLEMQSRVKSLDLALNEFVYSRSN